MRAAARVPIAEACFERSDRPRRLLISDCQTYRVFFAASRTLVLASRARVWRVVSEPTTTTTTTARATTTSDIVRANLSGVLSLRRFDNRQPGAREGRTRTGLDGDRTRDGAAHRRRKSANEVGGPPVADFACRPADRRTELSRNLRA